MKRLPTALFNLLRNPKTILAKADLYFVQLTNGQIITATDAQFDISTDAYSVGTQTFRATAFGQWSRGSITTQVGVQSHNVDVTVVAGTGANNSTPVYFPGVPSLTLYGGIRAGLLDGAGFTICTAYLTAYGQTVTALETKFTGYMGEVSDAGILKCTIRANDLLYMLNTQVPRNFLHPTCRHVFGDAGCGVNLTSYTETHNVAPGSNYLVIGFTSPSSFPVPRLAQGVLTWKTGANQGLSYSIRSHDSSTQITLATPILFAPQSNDQFTVTTGCDNTMGTCSGYYNNLIHFGGEPFIPSPESSI